MAAGDMVQLGSDYMVGYKGFSYTGYAPDGDITVDDTTGIENVPGEQNAPIGKLLTNPGTKISGTLRINDPSGTFTKPKKGDIISITLPGASASAKYLVEEASVRFGTKIALLNLTATREDSMAATYDAAT